MSAAKSLRMAGVVSRWEGSEAERRDGSLKKKKGTMQATPLAHP